jgi:D-xylose 1-dehydrogenase (NADP+, D-xylono-1,5-lactone-forming)
MDQRTIRYGILGYGRFAQKAIAPAIRNAPGSVLVAVQKRSMEEARKKADECGAPLAFSSVEELVRHGDVDAVYVAGSNDMHCPATIAAAEAGKHVMVEKPMALSAAEGEKMIAACARNNVRLAVGHMVRYSPLVQRAGEILRSGGIGTVNAVRAEFLFDARISSRTWMLDRKVAGGGPVFDLGVHCFDTIRYLLDGEPLESRAMLSPVPTATDTEHSAVMTFRFPRDIVATVSCSFISPMRKVSLEIIGSQGIIQIPDFTRSDIVGSITVIRGKNDRAASTMVEEVIVPDLYVEQIRRFTNWILGGDALAIDGENGLCNQRMADEVMRGEEILHPK